MGTVALAIVAVGGWVNGLIDEQGDTAAIEHQARENDRAEFELECRYNLAQPVLELDARQIDTLIAAVLADAEGNEAQVQTELDELREIRTDKAVALTARAGAVRACNRRAAELAEP
jgi:hypothetical protein